MQKFKFGIEKDNNEETRMYIEKDSKFGFTIEEIGVFINAFVNYGALSPDQGKRLCEKLNLLDDVRKEP